MQTTLVHQTLVGLSGLVLAVASHAARPLVTDDTGVLDQGSCELEAVLSRDKADGAQVDGKSLQLGAWAAEHRRTRQGDQDLRRRG